jgi:uncharacterized protein
VPDDALRAAVCRAYLSGVDAVGAAVGALTELQEQVITPCPRWTVNDLVNHLWCTAERYHHLLDAAVAGDPAPLVTGEDLGALNENAVRDTPCAAADARLREFRRAAVDYLHRVVERWEVAPYQRGSSASAGDICAVAAIEWHVHAWDLATALGHRYRPDERDAATLRESWLRAIRWHDIAATGDAWLAVLTAAGRRFAEETSPGAPVCGSAVRTAVADVTASWTPWREVAADEWDRGARTLYQSHAWITLEDTDPAVEVSVVASHRADGGDAALTVYAVSQEKSPEYDPRLLAPDLWKGSYLLLGGHRGYHSDLVAPTDRDAATGAAPGFPAAPGGGGLRPVLGDLGPVIDAVAAEVVARNLDGALALWATDDLASALHATSQVSIPILLGADTVISVPDGGFEAYLQSLPTGKRRAGVRREERRFTEAGLTVERRTLAEAWRECAPLLARLQSKYGGSGDPDTWSAVLESMSRNLPGSVVFLARFDGRATGFSLAYPFAGTLAVRAAGFDHAAAPAQAAQYFNLVLYQPVRYAVEHGLRAVHLGRDAYAAKVGRGAEVSLLWGVEVPRVHSALREDVVRTRQSAAVERLVAEFAGVEYALEPALARARRRGWL